MEINDEFHICQLYPFSPQPKLSHIEKTQRKMKQKNTRHEHFREHKDTKRAPSSLSHNFPNYNGRVEKRSETFQISVQMVTYKYEQAAFPSLFLSKYTLTFYKRLSLYHNVPYPCTNLLIRAHITKLEVLESRPQSKTGNLTTRPSQVTMVVSSNLYSNDCLPFFLKLWVYSFIYFSNPDPSSMISTLNKKNFLLLFLLGNWNIPTHLGSVQCIYSFIHSSNKCLLVPTMA